MATSTTKKEEKHALYLVPKEGGKPELIHADDVEDKRKAGYTDPTGTKANGTKWNDEDDIAQQDVAADQARVTAEYQGKKQAAKDKENEAALKQQEAAEKPDMKVQIVEPPKAKK